MTTDKTTAEIDPIEPMFFGIQMSDLANVITDRIQQTLTDILGSELGHLLIRVKLSLDLVSMTRTFKSLVGVVGLMVRFLPLEHLTETGGDRRTLQANLAIVLAVDIPDEHVDLGVITTHAKIQHLIKTLGVRQEG